MAAAVEQYFPPAKVINLFASVGVGSSLFERDLLRQLVKPEGGLPSRTVSHAQRGAPLSSRPKQSAPLESERRIHLFRLSEDLDDPPPPINQSIDRSDIWPHSDRPLSDLKAGPAPNQDRPI